MADKYSTIQQHQPLRTPSGWDKQEKALVVQLDEVFDDIYRRFGRLSINDFNKETRTFLGEIEGDFTDIKADIHGLEVIVGTGEGLTSTLTQTAISLTGRVEDAEGDIGDLEVWADGIELSVSNKYDIRSGIAIDAAGINITGGKYIRIKSGSTNIIEMDDDGMKLGSGGDIYIKSGGTFTLQSGNFTIDSSGNAELKGNLEVGSGKEAVITGTGKLKLVSGSNSLIEIGSTGIDIKTGGTFTVQSGKFSIDSSGNVTFAGRLDAATGTFAGTLSAACVTSGTMSAERIKGDTLTLGGNNNANGKIVVKDASGTTIGQWNKDGIDLKAGTINASLVTISHLDASKIDTGTLSASYIEGGTLTMGGANNGSGKIVVKDASDTTIGKWNKDGIEIKSGSIKADCIDIGTMSANRISGGTIDATDVTITNIDATKITVNKLSASMIEGGTLKLGGSLNGYGSLEIRNGADSIIGTWDNNGVDIKKGSLQSSNWIFDDNGATYATDLGGATRRMRVGYMTYGGNQPADAGLYFSLNTTDYTTELTLATNYAGAAAGRVILNGTGQNASALYQLGGVSLGKSDRPWMYGHLHNLLSTDMLKYYPKRSNPTGAYWYMDYNSTSGNNYFGSSGAAASYIGQSGNDKITNGYFTNIYYDNANSSSSREVKHDIKILPDFGKIIDRLNPVSFVYNHDKKERKRFGLIWEEAVDVLPEICTEDDGEKGITYPDLIPVLLKEIQSLRQRVAALEGGKPCMT